MGARYVFDEAAGTFTVQAFKTGLLSTFGHSPTFAVRGCSGTARFNAAGVAGFQLEMTIVADSLSLIDSVGDSDRREIERRTRDEVLESKTFPEIGYRAERLSDYRIGAGRYRLRIGGPLSLHGQAHVHQVDVELTVYDDGLEIRGDTIVRLSDYRIKPVSALAGAIKLKDELRVVFALFARKETTRRTRAFRSRESTTSPAGAPAVGRSVHRRLRLRLADVSGGSLGDESLSASPTDAKAHPLGGVG